MCFNNDIEQVNNTKENAIIKINIAEIISSFQKLVQSNSHINYQILSTELPSCRPIWTGVDPLALVNYTSGSTGEPKGVLLTHQNLLARLNWQWNKDSPISFNSDDIAMFRTNVCFIDSPIEVFGAVGRLINSIITLPEIMANPSAFVALARRHGVTRIVLVPSPWKAIADFAIRTGEKLESLRTIIYSGEPLKSSIIRKTRVFCPFANRLINLYGATETSGDVLYEELMDDQYLCDREEAVPVGRPLDNTCVYLLDSFLNPVPDGEVGEIYVSGALIARGYLGASTTAFIENPFAKEGTPAMYCTAYTVHILIFVYVLREPICIFVLCLMPDDFWRVLLWRNI